MIENTLKLGAAALNQTPLDWDGNKKRILEAIKNAQEEQVHVLTLPELSISGYGLEDAFFFEEVSKTSLLTLKEIIPHTKDIAVCLGLPVFIGENLFNCGAVVYNKKLLGIYCKQFLAKDGVYYEPRWFSAWPKGETVDFKFYGEKILVGDVYFNIFGKNIGVEICEDAWVEQRPANSLIDNGAEIILNPSASHFELGKDEIKTKKIFNICKNSKLYYAYANLVGNESGGIIYDGRCYIQTPNGLHQNQGFSFSECSLISKETHLKLGYIHDATAIKNSSSKVDKKATQKQEESKDVGKFSISDKSFMDLTHAAALGLFDYLRKSRCRGYVISLSGGADSGVVAILSRLSLQFAIDQYGENEVLKKLGHSESQIENFYGSLIKTVYQKTKNSTQRSQQTAKSIAKSIGANFSVWEVDELTSRYQSLVEESINLKLNWNDHDLALQNIQARVRGPGVWMIANVFNYLLLVTSNRSELSVGYNTVDGDTCGSLAPIAGVDKWTILKWLEWMHKNSSNLMLDPSGLELLIQNRPSAELRPGHNQYDEDDLMPYEILSFIETKYLYERLSIQDMKSSLEKNFSSFSKEELAKFLEKFLILWHRSQWKREKSATGFHLMPHSVDPKYWCRYPVLSNPKL